MSNIESFIENLRQNRRIETFDESATKQAVVLRLLSILGWDTFDIDAVTPEYSVANQRIDYSLRIQNINKVFIEVKKIGEDLERHQEQLLNYSFQEGVKLAVLTNGVSWWFYLPLNEGSWEQRKFYTIDILQQESDDIIKKFQDFLDRDNVETGAAVQKAEQIYHNQQKRQIARRSLPKAWNKLIEEPDGLLIELLAETAERLSGYKTDLEEVAEFMKKYRSHLVIPEEMPRRGIPSRKSSKNVKIRSKSSSDDYTGKNVVGFSFRERKYTVSSWRDFLILLCEVLSQKHSSEFSRVLELQGRKRPYFSRNPNELREPARIGNTGIFTETNLSANGKVKRAYEVLSLFNYKSADLTIETAE